MSRRERANQTTGAFSQQLPQPDLIGDQARVRIELVVPDPSRDEVDALEVDEWNPGSSGD
jgi:hypothetical protein